MPVPPRRGCRDGRSPRRPRPAPDDRWCRATTPGSRGGGRGTPPSDGRGGADGRPRAAVPAGCHRILLGSPGPPVVQLGRHLGGQGEPGLRRRRPSKSRRDPAGPAPRRGSASPTGFRRRSAIRSVTTEPCTSTAPRSPTPRPPAAPAFRRQGHGSHRGGAPPTAPVAPERGRAHDGDPPPVEPVQIPGLLPRSAPPEQREVGEHVDPVDPDRREAAPQEVDHLLVVRPGGRRSTARRRHLRIPPARGGTGCPVSRSAARRAAGAGAGRRHDRSGGVARPSAHTPWATRSVTIASVSPRICSKGTPSPSARSNAILGDRCLTVEALPHEGRGAVEHVQTVGDLVDQHDLAVGVDGLDPRDRRGHERAVEGCGRPRRPPSGQGKRAGAADDELPGARLGCLVAHRLSEGDHALADPRDPAEPGVEVGVVRRLRPADRSRPCCGRTARRPGTAAGCYNPTPGFRACTPWW